jgi:hypothetical protein
MKFMTNLVIISISVVIISVVLIRSSHARQAQNPSACGDVQQALVDRDRIKVGIARREVEKYFVQDGGGQFPSTTRYVYTRCRYLHVDIDFEAKGSAGQLFSGNDVVTKVSKLYVDYSTKD